MAIEDVIAQIAAEKAVQEKATAESKAAAAKAKAEKDAELAALKKEESTKKDAIRLEKERKKLQGIIKELASGKYEETSRGYYTLLSEAGSLDSSIKTLEKRLNITKAGEETKVGELPAGRVPFGGASVGGVTGPITGGIDTTKPVTPAKNKTPSSSVGLISDKKKNGKKDETQETPEVKLTKEEILNKYPIIDALFEQDPELRALLDKYLDPKSKMTLAQLKKELGQAQYNFKYADVIKDRLAKKAIFDRLGASATGQSDYEREVARIAAAMESTAIDLGASVTKEDLNRLASNIYMAGTEANPLIIERALTPYIKLGVSPTTGRPTVGGAAGANYQTLVNTAKANGVKEENLARSLGFASADDILRRLAEGEPIGTFQQRLRDIAAYGRSDYVKNLLAQGTDFDVIISPYRNMMADVLEIANPEQISLDDPTLAIALGKEEMTLSDFRRALRKDARWQYTQNARDEVSNVALSVLKDFGFQG
jgi:hypothetical protein